MDDIIRLFGEKRTDIWCLEYQVSLVKTAKDRDQWIKDMKNLKSICENLLVSLSPLEKERV